jgi:hypothetical protein
MKGRLLALTVGLLLLIAGPAAAGSSPFGGQSADQSAGNMQSATSSATSTQYNPSNENISVRVLSPGNDGSVSQSNNSSAKSGAANFNGTRQAVSQDQAGSGSAAAEAMQQAAQWAGSGQSADSTADSTQKNPSNENISVRVKSPGDNGTVDQSNNSDAKSFAGNKNATMQDTSQSQGGSDAVPMRQAPSTGSSDLTDGRVDPCGCGKGSGSKSIQAAGQDASNWQSATSDATSTQYNPSNENISVRVKSPGDNGSVDQSNNSDAESFAGNSNKTMQGIEQTQPGGSGGGPVVLSKLCGCLGHSVGIQAAAQEAWNQQDATSHATSEQFMPQNVNKSLRLGSSPDVHKRPPTKPGYGSTGDVYKDAPTAPADGVPTDRVPIDGVPIDGSSGDVSQQNNSQAKSKALNLNLLWQDLMQTQGPSGGAVITL